MTYKVGILTTHPIQYQVPWFRELSKKEEIDLTVFFCMIPDARQQGDGFGISFQWDIPIINGYKYEVLKNVASKPSVTNFWGCDTPNIRNIVKMNGFDIFIVNGWVVKSCVQLLFACRKYRLPCIVMGDSNSLHERNWLKRLVHRGLLQRYSAFLSCGKANRNFYIKNGVISDKIFFAPRCIENDRFGIAASELSSERDNIRAEWKISPSIFTFLFCAKFIEKKRPMDLLKAFNIAYKKTESSEKQIHLLMAGDGELKSKCGNYAKRNNLPVIFSGFLNQSEIVSAYVASDCLVLPSDYGETWGLVVNEAMACGLPAIVSDRVGCWPDLVEEGVTGSIFPFGDIDALAEKLILFAKNPKKTKAMGERSEKLIRKYSVEEVVKGTMDAIKYVCR
jgi:glycosyltransferase involved in cell wall biosynthesis